MCIQTPPPAEEKLMGIPDYFCGRLIYETDDGDSCRWVVYDGTRKQRFPSRQAAEKWCTTHSYQATTEDISKIMLNYARLVSVYKSLDSLACVLIDERVMLQGMALTIRRLADKLDNINAKYVQNFNKEGCNSPE